MNKLMTKVHLLKNAVITRFFLRQYYKLFFYESRGSNRNKGKFRVLYNDGRTSERMCYKAAKDYASIFGGRVLNAF
jgi:hypothetical protein